MKNLHVLIIGLIIVISGIIVPLLLIFHFNKPTPDQLKIEITPDEINTCADHIAWFLATITGLKTDIEPFNISITANTSIRTEYVLWASSSPKLIELLIYPNESHVDTLILIEVVINTSSTLAVDSVLVDIWNWTPSNSSAAEEKQAPFIQFLANNYPDLGINDSLSWTPICNDAGILIVGHYLFLSEYWEMEISWHVMIPPHDWVKCYIRYRGNLTPSWGGQIDSWNNSDPVLEVSPPSTIYRPR